MGRGHANRGRHSRRASWLGLFGGVLAGREHAGLGVQARHGKLWNVATRADVATLEGHGHTGGVGSVAFSSDGSTLAAGSSDNTVRFWDVATRTETATLEGHRGWVYSVAFSPDGDSLASGSQDGTVRLWDVATRSEVATLEGHSGWVYSVAFSPDGDSLASGSQDGTVRLWDVAREARSPLWKGIVIGSIRWRFRRMGAR